MFCSATRRGSDRSWWRNSLRCPKLAIWRRWWSSGIADIYRRGARIAATGQAPVQFIEYSSGDEYPLGQVSAAGGAYALASLKVALEKLESGIVDAIVYAPLNKQAMKLRRHAARG